MPRKLIIVALLALAGCERAQTVESMTDAAVAMEIVAPAAGPAAQAYNEASASGQRGAATLAAAPIGPLMAYIYRYELELPGDRAAGVMAAHEQSCVKAGPAICQVVSSNSDLIGRDALSAKLELRAAPSWVARFRAGVADEARAAGGKVTTASAAGEDLTLSLTDTEARLRAQTTLRDRLQQLLATRNGDLGELLKVEGELARVQGEIDAAQSTLAVLRTRVATSRLEIDYRSEGQLAGDGVLAPVEQALSGALGAFMATVGVLITILAIVAPIGLVVVPVVWLILRRRQRHRAAALALKERTLAAMTDDMTP